MATIKRNASAHWSGTGKEGKGTITTQSGVLCETPYSFSRRFGDEKGTNPEELIAAAHAGCFTMALAFQLSGAGKPPESLDTKADVSLEQVEGGWKISAVALTLKAQGAGPVEGRVHEACRDREGELSGVEGAERGDHAGCDARVGRRPSFRICREARLILSSNEDGGPRARISCSLRDPACGPDRCRWRRALRLAPGVVQGRGAGQQYARSACVRAGGRHAAHGARAGPHRGRDGREHQGQPRSSSRPDKVNLAVAAFRCRPAGRGTQTVLIMRREAAVLIAPKAGKMQKIADLQNATIGVTREGPLDGSLLGAGARLLRHHRATRRTTLRMQGDEIANAFRQKKIDAMICGRPDHLEADERGRLRTRHAASKVRSSFIEIEEADAIVKRIPALESVEIEQGAFGGRPPRPAESFNTLGYSIRLVTNPKTDTDKIAELARQLFLIRQNHQRSGPGRRPDGNARRRRGDAVPDPSGRARLCERRAADLVRQVQRLDLSRRCSSCSGLGSVAAGMFGWMRERHATATRRCRVRASRRCSTRVRDASTPEAARYRRARGRRDVRLGVCARHQRANCLGDRHRELQSGAGRTAPPDRGAARGARGRLIFAGIMREDIRREEQTP